MTLNKVAGGPRFLSSKHFRKIKVVIRGNLYFIGFPRDTLLLLISLRAKVLVANDTIMLGNLRVEVGVICI